MALILKRTLIVLFAALAVILASLPLAQTEWAEDLRTRRGHGARGKPLTRQDEARAPDSAGFNRRTRDGAEANNSNHRSRGTMRYLLPFVKVFTLMGIPALLTICIVRIGKAISRAARVRRWPA